MENVIVSFTSYPKRIGTVHKVLDSIIHQTVLPDKIVLYLSSSEFEGFGSLPDFSKYKSYGFEIQWNEENLKSHKKWFYAFQEYEQGIVITIDDDILYHNRMLETLLHYHECFPDCVIARNVHLISCNDDGTIAPYESWCGWCGGYAGVPRMDLEAVGNAGILYPTYLFHNTEIFKKDIFMGKCQYADDLWMKVMEVYLGIPTVLTEERWGDSVLKEHQVSCLFENHNKNGGNDRQLESLLELYPYTRQKELLIDSIFADGHVYCKDVKIIEEREMEEIITELKDKLSNYGEFLVYGAGDVGRRIYSLLQGNGEELIKAFIVKNPVDNVRKIKSIEVKNYKEFIDDRKKILIALFDDEKTKEVLIELVNEGINKDRIVTLNTYEKEILMSRIRPFFDSGAYWEERYQRGGSSGAGSYNRLAEFKAEVINSFVKENNIEKVIEWGCGDGNQLTLAEYPAYIGFDVSQQAVKLCKERFSEDSTKKFIWCGDNSFKNEYQGDLAMSLDVIYHLTEDEVYGSYMERLFSSSKKYVCIYSSNFEREMAIHVKNRKFTDWIEENLKDQWELLKTVPNKYPYSEDDPDNTSWSDFYFYIKRE